MRSLTAMWIRIVGPVKDSALGAALVCGALGLMSLCEMSQLQGRTSEFEDDHHVFLLYAVHFYSGVWRGAIVPRHL